MQFITQHFRPPQVVMDIKRLGAMHQNRISFVRSLVRKIAREKWQIHCTRWDMDKNGYGVAIYKTKTAHATYNFVVFADYIDDCDRNDRVVAEKWDVTFCLIQGDITPQILDHLRRNVPLQEMGRNTAKSLVLARANKSVRVFEHMVSALVSGRQPDIDVLTAVGYILRTSAVYGNGKFGIADFAVLADNPDFKMSFSVQMYACYMLREFSIAWVNYIAKQKNSHAVKLEQDIAEFLGVGNATGLGMAPYLLNHPQIVDTWLTARESAIATVSIQPVTKVDYKKYICVLQQAISHLQLVKTINPQQQEINTTAIQELQHIINLSPPHCDTWGDYIKMTTEYILETQEIILSALVEIYPELVDIFENHMNAYEDLRLGDTLTISHINQILHDRYAWALSIDFSHPDNSYWFWYASEIKEEPRIGMRYKEDGHEQEFPLDIARQVCDFYRKIKDIPAHTPLDTFLLQYPKYRTICRRIWTMGHTHMGDIQCNSIGKDMLPMDLLRCKLAVFGATKFDPRSDKWVRVTLFQGAPLYKNISDISWIFPTPPSNRIKNASQPK